MPAPSLSDYPSGWAPQAQFLPQGGKDLGIMRWGEPGYVLETVGPKSLVSVSTYNLRMPSATEKGYGIPHTSQKRMKVKNVNFGTFIKHLTKAEHQHTNRMYIEDTYIVDFMHKPSASHALRRLTRDLPPTNPPTMPLFPGFEHVQGALTNAVAVFIGNTSETAAHFDANVANFIVQVNGCKDIVTAPPQATDVLGVNPMRCNDALVDTSRRNLWTNLLPIPNATGAVGAVADTPPTLKNGTLSVPGVQHFRMCAGDAVFLPEGTWHALYGHPVPAGGAPSITVAMFYDETGKMDKRVDGTRPPRRGPATLPHPKQSLKHKCTYPEP